MIKVEVPENPGMLKAAADFFTRCAGEAGKRSAFLSAHTGETGESIKEHPMPTPGATAVRELGAAHTGETGEPTPQAPTSTPQVPAAPTAAEAFGGLSAPAPAPIPQVAPAPQTPAPAPQTPAPSGNLDSAGMPWDARIHAGNKARVKDGRWRYKTKVPDELKAQVEAELRAAMGAPAQDVQPAQPGSPMADLAKVMGDISKWIAAGKITQPRVEAIAQSLGLESVAMLGVRPDLCQALYNAIEAEAGPCA